jgi:hypothetical protein
VQNPPNKGLTSLEILQNPDNKGDSLQNILNKGVTVGLVLWEAQSCGWWILSVPG